MSRLLTFLKSLVLVILNLPEILRVSAAQPSEYLDPERFVRRRYHASSRVGNWIYIDGGEFSWIDSAGALHYGTTNWTSSLDLSQSWNNSTVELKEIDRGVAPLLNLRTFWVQNDTIYTYGGEVSWLSSFMPVPPTPWKLATDGRGGGEWIEGTVATGSQFSSLVQPASGSHTFGDGIGYYFGGHLVDKTWPSVGWYPVTGLVTYNMTSNIFVNSSSLGYGNLVPHHGVAQFVPSFGPSGLVIWMGGQDSTDKAITFMDPVKSFSNITIYDPGSKKWYWQMASGLIPEWRDRACAVGVQGENNTYEIFLYAGASTALYGGPFPTEDEIKATNALDEVYVLTLPAFVWFKANYAAKASRQGHTCHIVGNRQLLTIGGMDPAIQEFYALARENATDPFAQGLGIFDLTDLTWSDRYDADAPPYKSPQVVSSYYQKSSRFPIVWNSNELRNIFGDRSSPTPVSAFPTSLASTAPSSPSSSYTTVNSTISGASPSRQNPTSSLVSSSGSPGVIAGIVIGAAVALALVCGLIYYYARWQRNGDRPKHRPKIKAFELDSRKLEELPSAHRTELPEHQYWEMPADPLSPKVGLPTLRSSHVRGSHVSNDPYPLRSSQTAVVQFL